MAEDPRKFTVKNCAAATNTRIADDQKRKDFFGSLGKIGDIEVLNRFGDGKITSGLRSLSKISDSIRTGDTNSAIIPNSSGYVLDAVGINQTAAQTAGQFNPGVLNRGTAQAESILVSVKAGEYKLEDIPNTITDLQNLGQLVDGIFNDGSGQRSTKENAICGASPYAIDLIQYAPKYKFLFIVQITLSDDYQNGLEKTANNLAFVVKTSTRPNVNIEHEEVNMYNFWTRIPKRAIYEPVTMRFYDDNKGLAHLFYTSYLESISPIARLGGNNSSEPMSAEWLAINSMGFNEVDSKFAASLTALEGNNTSIIKEIKLFHVYDYGKFMNVYHFYNPKLLTMNLDDLDAAESGSGNEIEFQFAYDAMHITPAFSVSDNIESVKAISGGAIGATYPINPHFLGGSIEQTPEGIDGEGNVPKPVSANKLISDAFADTSTFNGTTFV